MLYNTGMGPTPSKRPRHGAYPAGCVVAYLRVSTNEQVDSGAGLIAQRAAIASYAARTGLTVDHWFTDEGVSGSIAPLDRPALSKALAILGACRSGVLLVGKSDRVARKTADLLALRDRAKREGWTLSAADGSVDWSTSHGRAMSTVMGAFAELERDLIGTRTREGMAAKKAQGVRLGRPVTVPDDVRERIAKERTAGRTLAAIADGLSADGVPTVGNGANKPGKTAKRGVRWYPSTVRSVLVSVELDEFAKSRRQSN